jgi:adenine-specific DNA methylase
MQLIENASAEKLRGAYYTPDKIASFILKWAIYGKEDADILEPSCGDGVFIERVLKEDMPFRSMTAVEFEAKEAQKASNIGLRDTTVFNMDFHRFCLDTELRFDIVIGNPPFIRYQYYDEGQQSLADEIFHRAGLKRTKLTNAWVTFVVGSSLLLKDSGKIGFVIPSELLQVKYAQQLRNYLASHFNKINIISFENLVFEEIQQEVVLLLCEKNGSGEHLIEHIEVKDADALETLNPYRLKFPTKNIDFHLDKWTYYFLEKEELDFLGKVNTVNMPTISSYANVEVGITTGSNDFFTVPQSIVDFYSLNEYARPMVGRSVQVNSLCFTTKDWKKNNDSGAKANLLVFPSTADEDGNENTKLYLDNGKANGIADGYKTSIRDKWYVIPSVKTPSDALFLRRNNLYPKFVVNDAKAYTTDTMHRVYLKQGVNCKALVASYYNSLSFAFAEILGRNFGGGCLELMPSEVGGIFLPYKEENESVFEQIDKMVREKKTPDEILDFTDEVILCQGYGLSKKEAQLARSIWHKIINRRLGREAVEKTEVQKEKKQPVKQLNFLSVLQEYPESIVENGNSEQTKENEAIVIESKNVLVSLVKTDNMSQYLDQSAKVYYTGRRFPATVALNKLYYFMPYVKGKGVKDLYFIKMARVGTKQEVHPECDDNDFRLVFEIEYVKQLFDDYRPIHLDIWRTFTDTTITNLIQRINEADSNVG